MEAVLEPPEKVKDIDYYLALPYPIEVIQEDESTWFARIPDLPGCITEADTAEEVMAMIRDAQTVWIESSLELGRHIPEPMGISEYSGTFSVRIPRSLHRDAARAAEREGVSLNQFVNVALAKAVASAR